MLMVWLMFLNNEFIMLVVMIWVLLKNLFLDEEFFLSFKMMDLNFWMLILVLLLYVMMLSVSFNYKLSMNFLFLCLFYLMFISNFLVFFMLYEMVFILIMFVIILLGYNYERLMAAYLMMFYSFLFSSPSLMMMIIFDYTFLMKNWLQYTYMYNYFLVFSFMVKFPIFGFHYWLPVAHVEASTIGSMLLAGILLKLGSMGIFYVIIYLKFMVKFHWLILGLLIVMMMILNLSDLKMMIAYSSVAHMSLVFYVSMMGSMIAKKGALMMMFYHGFLSPIMFWTVGLLAWWKTRSLMVVKMLNFTFMFLLVLFIMVILNMSFPPFLGFLSEIYMLKSLYVNSFIMYCVILSVLFSCYYNIYFFWAFQGKQGFIFKTNVFSLDVYMFMLWCLMLNF